MPAASSYNPERIRKGKVMVRVFVSYSHKDEVWKNRLVGQLEVLGDVGVDPWDDRRIAAGADWQAEIEDAIEACDVAVLLISAPFLTSGFIAGHEIPPLLKRRQEQGVRVIPLILSACQWPRINWLQAIQARPTDGKPLSGMNDHDAETALSALAGEIADLHAALPARRAPGQAVPPERIQLKLPAGATHFLGRDEELAELDAAWADSGGTAVVTLIAPGGVGKTALLKRWLDRMKAANWCGAHKVFGWTFYSQGSGDDRQASDDHFLADALVWFGVEIAATASAEDKGRRLGEAVAKTRTLLVLDGVEPLQYPPGAMGGRLRAPGLRALLDHLAGAGQPGLCVLSSRERLEDLAEYERRAGNPTGCVRRRELGNLGAADGARLLYACGVTHAGTAPIDATDPELLAASQATHGHALTLSLLGNYLRLAFDGDIRRRDRVDFSDADAETGGHAFRVMAAYETWFAREGQAGAREAAALRLLGFFDRPAQPESLAALRAAPVIEGLTDALVGAGDKASRLTFKRIWKRGIGFFGFKSKPSSLLGEGVDELQWQIILHRLRECGLILPAPSDAPLDAHPLVREYHARRLQRDLPAAWREGHRRIYQQLKDSVSHQPDDLDGLQPLYQAMAHGCKAGLHQAVLDEVYIERILRGTGSDGFYTLHKLCAFGADLAAVACFFDDTWHQVSPQLSEMDCGWVLGQAAFDLRAVGRLEEALEPMHSSAEMTEASENWLIAAIRFGDLSELRKTLGQLPGAVQNARQAVAYADACGDDFQRMVQRTTLADALHEQGDTTEALALFAEAEALQAKRQPDYPSLYSLQGLRYCELLLCSAERAAWQVSLAMPRHLVEAIQRECVQVRQRAAQTLEWIKPRYVLLDIGLGLLTLARCALYQALLAGEAPQGEDLDDAFDFLRRASQLAYVPRGLLTRAWFHHARNNPDAARADLAEAQRIATRGGMKLHLADIHLTRARLFRDPAELAQARALIEECGYFRRLPELEDAEAALGVAPAESDRAV